MFSEVFCASITLRFRGELGSIQRKTIEKEVFGVFTTKHKDGVSTSGTGFGGGGGIRAKIFMGNLKTYLYTSITTRKRKKENETESI